MSLCNGCTNTTCDSRCPYELRERRIAARCKCCGTHIYDGEDALKLSKILSYDNGYICIDCVHDAIMELWLEDTIGE